MIKMSACLMVLMVFIFFQVDVVCSNDYKEQTLTFPTKDAEIALNQSDKNEIDILPTKVSNWITSHEDPFIQADKKPEIEDVSSKAEKLSEESPSDTSPPLGINFTKNETAKKAIDKNIVFFSERLRHRFSVWLERSAKYLEIMKDILSERGLPEELVFLPIIESGFNMNAYSRASAVGPWQFIAGTAKRYGLTIDWWRDERKDPVKSTEAAASYLKDLYRMFGAWHLALAAYNAGEGKIMKALRKTGSDDYWDLLKTKQIHNETKEYVPRYIAATKIARTPDNYGFENLEYQPPLEFEEVIITEPLDIDTIALAAETTPETIKELNPELRRWCTPLNVREYTVRIPLGSKELFFENLETIPQEKRLSFDYYKVKKGDTIKKVSINTGYPVAVILALNSLQGIETLTPGETLRLPPKDKFTLDLTDLREKNRSAIKQVAYKKSDKGNTKKGSSKKPNPKSKKQVKKKV